ncbi:mitochondrial acidic protein mam33 [Cucumis melo var. makuwa]|uniref:Mitochondrial acidic protein mam33 n=1 Tax=Cucumis melo var. makuwa TaxID=1194695 RepID=A0A5A7V534_CUCMM|nr:mitochondrial acidic protein mam33 [Cucumis melo var. makuwa]
MVRTTQLFRKARKTFQDLRLLQILQSEIAHELSSTPCQNYENNGSSSHFTVEHDSLKSQDVVLRRKMDSGEEVVISALLGPLRFGYDGAFPREILMKICVSKPGVSSLLQFDCGVSEDGHGGSPFKLYNAYYLRSSDCLGPSVYRGPSFRTLAPNSIIYEAS